MKHKGEKLSECLSKKEAKEKFQNYFQEGKGSSTYEDKFKDSERKWKRE